jgi:hypothetical protein
MIAQELYAPEAQKFYAEAINILAEANIDFMIGGAFAVFHYAGIHRDTKDLDVYCKPSDFPSILKLFHNKGFRTEQTDVRWLGKIFSDDGHFIDLIFDTVNNLCKVDDYWLEQALNIELFGKQVKIIPVEELVWGKLYVQNRERFDGADLNHIFLSYGKNINWEKLYRLVDPHWHLLLAQILMFQFVYPSEYASIIPKWLFDELIRRANEQYDVSQAVERVCRGPLIDQTQYEIDVKQWNYKSYTIKSV